MVIILHFLPDFSMCLQDVMIPAYHCYHPAAFFFILYLIIGLYFIMNLILAVAYSHFQEKTKETVLESGAYCNSQFFLSLEFQARIHIIVSWYHFLCSDVAR